METRTSPARMQMNLLNYRCQTYGTPTEVGKGIPIGKALSILDQAKRKYSHIFSTTV